MKVAWKLRSVSGVLCFPSTNKDTPNLVQSWGPGGQEADIDPARAAGIGAYETVQLDGAVAKIDTGAGIVWVFLPE